MVMLPPTLLRPGRNELDVRAAPSGIYPMRFPRVSVGPLAEIEPLYDRRLFWTRSVPEITVVVSLLVAGLRGRSSGGGGAARCCMACSGWRRRCGPSAP